MTEEEYAIITDRCDRLWTLVNTPDYAKVFVDRGLHELVYLLAAQLADIGHKHIGEDVLEGMTAEDAIASELGRMQLAWAAAVASLIGHLTLGGNVDADVSSL